MPTECHTKNCCMVKYIKNNLLLYYGHGTSLYSSCEPQLIQNLYVVTT